MHRTVIALLVAQSAFAAPSLLGGKMKAETEERPWGKKTGIYWKEGAPVRELVPGNRLLWFNRDPNWENVLGFRGKNDVEKPVGEWNHFTITCKSSLVIVVFNGEEVIHADLDKWTEAHKNPDGTPNKFKVALKDFARTGPLGLQGLHGKEKAPVWYRNLKIKTLE